MAEDESASEADTEWAASRVVSVSMMRLLLLFLLLLTRLRALCDEWSACSVARAQESLTPSAAASAVAGNGEDAEVEAEICGESCLFTTESTAWRLSGGRAADVEETR